MKNIYEGNVEITKENQAEWRDKGIEKITGYVYVNAGGVTFPLLKEVGGDVSVNAGGVKFATFFNKGDK